MHDKLCGIRLLGREHEADFAAVKLGDLADNGKAKSGAVSAGAGSASCNKWGKDLPGNILGDAGAIIGNSEGWLL